MRTAFLIFLISFSLTLSGQNWDWAEKIGGSANDLVYDMVTDNQGNIYVTGRIKFGIQFGKGSDTLTPSAFGYETDLYVAKYDKNRNLKWANRWGGYQPDWGRGLAVDDSGNVYFTGDFCDTADFGGIQLIADGPSIIGDPFGANRNVVIGKIDSLGKTVWVRKAGGANGHSRGYAIELDSEGNIFVGGHMSGVCNFEQLSVGDVGKTLGFVAKYSNSGNAIWVEKMASINGSWVEDLKVDSKNKRLYICGDFKRTLEFADTTFSGLNPQWGDAFIACLDLNGDFVWGNIATGAYATQFQSISFSTDRIYVSGDFSLTVDIGDDYYLSKGNNTGASSINTKDVIVLALDNAGNFVWSKHIGSKLAVTSAEIHYVNDSLIAFTGAAVDSLILQEKTLAINKGAFDGYILGLNKNGDFSFYEAIGGNSDDFGSTITSDKHFNILIGGGFRNTSLFGNSTLTASDLDAFFGRYILPETYTVSSSLDTLCGIDSINFKTSLTGNYDSAFVQLDKSLVSYSIGNTKINNLNSGSYDLTIFTYKGVNVDSIKLKNFVSIGEKVEFSLGEDTTVCIGKSIVINTNISASSVYWFDGSTGHSLSISKSSVVWAEVSNDSICWSRDTVLIQEVPCDTVSIRNQNVFQSGLSIYPNPVVDQLLVEISILRSDQYHKIEIFDAFGGLLIEEKLNTGVNELNVQALASGYYFYKVYSADRNCMLSGKIIKL